MPPLITAQLITLTHQISFLDYSHPTTTKRFHYYSIIIRTIKNKTFIKFIKEKKTLLHFEKKKVKIENNSQRKILFINNFSSFFFSFCFENNKFFTRDNFLIVVLKSSSKN